MQVVKFGEKKLGLSARFLNKCVAYGWVLNLDTLERGPNCVRTVGKLKQALPLVMCLVAHPLIRLMN